MNHISQNYDDFKELGRERCPVCQHSDRCKANQSRSCIVCFRCRDEHSNGYRRIKENAHCCVYVLPDPNADQNGRPDRPSRGSRGGGGGKPILAPNGAVDRLAAELSVSVESIRALDLHVRHVPHHGNCPCFPERDGDGRIIGYNARLPDGTKKVGPGEKRGLYIPDNLASLPDPVLIVEGASDVAAALTMGLAAVGRANNTHGAPMLAKLLEGRHVIVVGENDLKTNGKWPGREGATKIACQLSAIWKKPVPYAMPPLGFKDVREYLIRNPNRDPVKVGQEILGGLRAKLIRPTAEDTASNNPTIPNSSISLFSSPPARKWPEPLDEVAFHGVAGDLVRIVEPHTEADPAAILICFLVAIGNAMGRHVYFIADGVRHYANLFAVLVGETSKGRKGTAWAQASQRLIVVAQQWHEERVTGGLSSGEGLIWQIRDPIYGVSKNKKTKSVETVLVDAGITDKRLMLIEAEFASVLRLVERQGNTLSPIVRKAWESGNLRALTKNSPAKATGAHVSIIGDITVDELRRYLDRTEIANGFGNRFLWLCVRRSKCLPEGGHVDDRALEKLSPRIALALDFGRVEQVLHRDEDAKKLWAQIYPDLSEGRPGLAGALTARAEAQVMRLAMVYAILDCSHLIRVEHLTAAIAVWEYCAASVVWCFGNATGDPVADFILEGLQMAGENGLTRTEISYLLGRNLKAERIGTALAVLKARRLAVSAQEETEGRSAERWFASRAKGNEKNE